MPHHKKHKRVSTRNMPPALARWHRANNKKHHHPKAKAKAKAKRKRTHKHAAEHKHMKKKTHHHKKRHAGLRRHARRARRAVGGMLGRLIPTTNEAVSAATAAMYGRLEGDAAKDASHFLRSVPAPLAMIGRSGNLALAAWILGAVTRQPLIRAGANGLVDVAAYQFMRRPGEYKEGDIDFKLSGSSRGLSLTPTRSAQLVDRYLADDADDDDDDA